MVRTVQRPLLTSGSRIPHHTSPYATCVRCRWRPVISRYYPFIAPVVQEVCAKHNVRYTYFPSLLANLASTVRYMKQSGGWHRD